MSAGSGDDGRPDASLALAEANAAAGSAVAVAMAGAGGLPPPTDVGLRDHAGHTRHAVASPGSRHTPVLLALAAHPDIDLHMVLDERAAAFFALGLARASGRAAVLCATSGTAGAHYLPAVAEAYAAGVPLVVITCDRPAALHHCGAPQTMSQANLFAKHVRWSCALPAPAAWGAAANAGLWRTQAARAVAAAEGMMPGPVHLNLAFDEPLWSSDLPPVSTRFDAPAVRTFTPHASLDAAQIDTLLATLRGATRGLVVCGPLPPHAAGRGAAGAVAELAEALGWPLIADACAQLRFGAVPRPPGLALITGADLLVRLPQLMRALGRPDCIVRCGALPTSKPLCTWLGRVGADAQVCTILVGENGMWHDPAFVTDLFCPVPARELCGRLVPRVRAAASCDATAAASAAWRQAWQHADARAHDALAQLDAAAHAPLTERGIARACLGAVPDGTLLHLASSMPIRDVDTFALGKREGGREGGRGGAAPSGRLGITISCSRGVNGIDGTVATAVGLAHAWHGGPTVVLLGDLALLHDVGALHMAAQTDVGLVLVVVDNAGGDIFSSLPIGALLQDHLQTSPPTGNDLQLPPSPLGMTAALDAYFRTPQKSDLRAWARAVGATYHVIDSLADLSARIDQACHGVLPTTRHKISAPDGTTRCALHILHVKIDPETSRMDRRGAIAAVGEALVRQQAGDVNSESIAPISTTF